MLFLVGCQTAYYGALEKFGIHKRDLLVERVEEARDTQEETKEQFKSALEQFSAVVNIESTELKQKYDLFSADLEKKRVAGQGRSRSYCFGGICRQGLVWRMANWTQPVF